MDKQKMAKFEIFCWGAFTATTILTIDNIFGYDVPAWAKIFVACLMFSAWMLYVFTNVNLGEIDPSKYDVENRKSNTKAIIIFLSLGVFIGFILIYLLK
ncbi:hypothetical protein QWY85_09875 [Neolewinella lacunae]|uniref:Transmembrane protein n=1 Tax=Neolewinella lacunae TaxID=1517758 RepID=A0A923PNV7_9BACT|nr:hypothetical protein [Neolewinella lacunae]MBC6993952.1 hypothetical protein [Neolewinella lacunae]MDN3634967.1 hypothetical protein [Neolewinella lacunae]